MRQIARRPWKIRMEDKMNLCKLTCSVRLQRGMSFAWNNTASGAEEKEELGDHVA